MPGIVRFPRGVPKSLREWERIFDPINEVIAKTPSGVTVAGDNIPSNDSPYVTAGAVSGLPGARPLAAKSGETVVTNTGTTMEVSLADSGTAGTYAKVVTDSKGRVVAGAALQTTDMPTTLQLIHSGIGSPNGVVVAEPGALYLNQSGGANTTLYVKESGSSNTGWIAK